MRRSLDRVKLMNEWSPLPKEWYRIYQWPLASSCVYTEWIAERTVESVSTTRLATDGLRQQRSFKVLDHRSQIELRTKIEQFTEKRFVCRSNEPLE